MAKKTSTYSVHPGVLTTQNWIASLKEKSGRSLDEWLALVQKKGGKDEFSRRDWLKKEHRMGTNSAWCRSRWSSGSPVPSHARRR